MDFRQYEATVIEKTSRKWKIRYDSDQKESLSSNTALHHLQDAEPEGPVFSDYEVEEIKPLAPKEKDILVNGIRDSLLSQGWKDTGKKFQIQLSLSVNGIDFVLKRLGDILILSASRNAVCIKSISYPEWIWKNLDSEIIMNDCDSIVKW